MSSSGIGVSDPTVDGGYRGRIAPTPSGYLHLGHARTFWTAMLRARRRRGDLILRMDDLDPGRSKPEYINAAVEDLNWFGIDWREGSERKPSDGPFYQSQRMDFYRAALHRLIDLGRVYRCYCSRKDVRSASLAPHAGDEGPLYSGKCRANVGIETPQSSDRVPCWRFRVETGGCVRFRDGARGDVSFTAGVDFGDFVVWRQDGVPAYQLAVVVDDHEMGVTEVVRGEDLLLSTCRQILIFEALGWGIPNFFHCPLMLNDAGERLSKRSDSMALRDYRARGWSPERIREEFGWDDVSA